jgi:pseudouridine-5'-phosphate glycosidase
MTSRHSLLALSEEVRDAFKSGQPVVALESTIISHGMPFPENLRMATEVEQIVRHHDAVPATIAVLDGVPRVGLDLAQLTMLASDPGISKVSIRDLPYIIATKRHGATTVAASMRLAARAGVRVLVTGGIGGVHKGGESSMDVSADLIELSRTEVAVVSAGVKSLLDIGRTLEVLETLGVPVITRGSDEFPAFYSRTSGFKTPIRLDSPAEIAATMKAKWELGLEGGVAVANPIPAADEIPASQIDRIISGVVTEAQQRHITGSDITPYLLGRMVQLTNGAALVANVALVKDNAHLGATIAFEYAQL